MKINRMIDGKNVEIELDAWELRRAYFEMQEEYDKDWMCDLLGDYGYDVKRIDSAQIGELASAYRKCLERGDSLGIAEHQAFECAVQEFDFPEYDEDCKEVI